MREILFRGKVVKHPDWTEMNGKWAVGFFVNALDEYPDDPDKERIPEIVSLKANNICSGEYSFYETFEVDPNTVSQYTGVVDKNGRMIFEGDIVRLFDKIRTVIFDEVMLEFELSADELLDNPDGLSLCSDYHECEVIGNIWDNPELLEKR